MTNRIPVLLDEETAAGLLALAKQEYRDPRVQAALIIRQELERRGLLQVGQIAAPIADLPQKDADVEPEGTSASG